MSIRRAFPQVYSSNVRLAIDHSALSISKGDFKAALNKVTPASRREAAGSIVKPLDTLLKSLLENQLKVAVEMVRSVFPPSRETLVKEETIVMPGQDTIIHEDSEIWIASLTDVDSEFALSSRREPPWDCSSISSYPRLQISGKLDAGQQEVAAAVLHHLEAFPVYSLDFPSLVSDQYANTVEQALVSRVQLAFKNAPSVLYLPDISGWWTSASESARSLLLSFIERMPMNLPVLWLSTVVLPEVAIETSSGNIPAMTRESLLSKTSIEISQSSSDSDGFHDERLAHINNWLCGRDKGRVNGAYEFTLTSPTLQSKTAFFASLMESLPSLPARIYAARRRILLSKLDVLVPSVDNQDSVITEAASEPTSEERDKNFLRELRNFFRTALHVLYKEKRFSVFCKPVDPEAVPDYYDIISYPMDLETIRMKVDEQAYPTYVSFYRDFERILFNAREYNPIIGKDARGKNIVHAAHSMVDHIESHSYSFRKKLGYDLFKKCEAIARKAGYSDPASPSEGDHMPERDAKFYRVIFARHQELKDEFGPVHPSDAPKEQADNIVAGSSAVAVASSPKDIGLKRSSRVRGDAVEALHDLASVKAPRSGKRKNKEESKLEDEEVNDEFSITVAPIKVEAQDEISTRIAPFVASINTESRVEPSVVPLSVEDIDAQPLMMSLRASVELASKVRPSLQHTNSACLKLSV